MIAPTKIPTWQPPQIFEVNDEKSFKPVQRLYDNGAVKQFFDPTKHALGELYDLAYPDQKDLPLDQKSNWQDFIKKYDWPKGNFVFYPWNGVLVRFLDVKNLRALRTSRNRNLITDDEQQILYDSTIFVAGLSVGSNIVEALVSTGIGSKFAVADMDIIEPSNLNRIRAPYTHVGVHKCDSVAIRMNEIDPYLQFDLYRNGITLKNVKDVIDQIKPTIIVDEIDQIQLKIALRRLAKQRKIPVVSAADDGDSALIDIERYDLNADTKIFNGQIPDDVLHKLEFATDIPRQQLGMIIGKYFVGSRNIPLRMFESLGEVGKTLPSWPQLGSAATQSGLAVAYACRKILLSQPIKSGRSIVGVDQIFDMLDIKNQTKLDRSRRQLDKFTF